MFHFAIGKVTCFECNVALWKGDNEASYAGRRQISIRGIYDIIMQMRVIKTDNYANEDTGLPANHSTNPMGLILGNK